jgi:uncharacterized alpha-E superfamily protein
VLWFATNLKKRKGVAAMANQYNDYDDDDDYDIEEESGPASLRKALKKAEREAKQLRDELTSLRSESRTRTVKDVLETKGVNPKIAAFQQMRIHPKRLLYGLTNTQMYLGIKPMGNQTTLWLQNRLAVFRNPLLLLQVQVVMRT